MSRFGVKKQDFSVSVQFLSVMDMSVSEELYNLLVECLSSGKKIILIADQVERITTPCLQMIFSLLSSVASSGAEVEIRDKSPAFVKALDDLGFNDCFERKE